MKMVVVGDAYINLDMMKSAVEKSSLSDLSVEYFYFGFESRREMRGIVQKIEKGESDTIELPEGYEKAMEDADIVMVHLCPVTQKIINKSKNLKYILCNRGGIENIDVDTATQNGIMVLNNPAHNANAVAEYTVGLILCETRNIGRAYMSLKNGEWREKFPNTETTIHEMHDLTIGLIGFGSVGRLVAERLESFKCKILVYDPYLDISAYDMLNVEFVELDELLKYSDVISLHARGRETIIGFKELSKMKKTAYFINTARSALVDYDALEKVLDNNIIMGAAIDVFDSEPNIPDSLRYHDNLTITNHRGGDTVNSYSDSPLMMLNNLNNYFNGRKPLFWLNRRALSK